MDKFSLKRAIENFIVYDNPKRFQEGYIATAMHRLATDYRIFVALETSLGSDDEIDFDFIVREIHNSELATTFKLQYG